MKLGSKPLTVVLLFVALVLVNYLASSIPARLDATAENIYTLSPGTKSMLAKIEEPIALDFYFTKSASGLPISYKNYAERVQEMLRQYARASGGRLTLNVIDPRPDTPEEERATAAGIPPQLLPSGEQIQFGLVATQADQQKIIATFNPQREQFLEYDLSQLIYGVQQFDKKKLGLLSSVPLRAPPFNPMMMQMGQRPPQNQFVIHEWERSFEIVPVEATATQLPDNLDALAVVHPQNLSPQLQYAVDQFLLSGKPVMIAVDPASQHFKRQGGQMAMFGGPQPNISSDLPTLLQTYGVAYDPQQIVGDLENATQVQAGTGGIVRLPTWLSLRREHFSAGSMATAQLNSALFVEPGALAAIPDSGLTFTPLIQSSERSGELAAPALQFAQPDDLARQLTPSGRKTIAALVTGKFNTAFPNGAPNPTPPPHGDHDHDTNEDEEKENATAPTVRPHLAKSSTMSTLLVVADTDFLLDDYSVRKYNFFGQVAAEPLNDNLAFAANAVELLGGSPDLISIRGKGSSIRPFDVVHRMEVEANQRYQERLAALEARLADVQSRLSELQGKSTEGNRLVASPEVAKAIEDFQKQQAALRGERREIRRALRENIDALENGLLALNLAASPLLVGLFGLWFYRRRHG